MKTNYKFFALVALAGVFAFSCSKDDVKAPVEQEEKPDTPADVEDGLKTVTFSADILLTRAALGSDGKTVTWESTDHIAVYDGTARRDFSVKSLGVDGRTAVFEGSVAEDATEFYAVYPYSVASETLPTAEGVISLTYPAEQTVSASGIASGALVCVAKADENKALAFKNVSSLLKIHIPGGDVTSVTVKGNNSEKFAGATTTAVAADAAEGDASGITLRPSGATFAEGDYWFGLLPVTFENGFTLTYEKEGAKAFVKTTKRAGFERNAGLDVTTSTASVDWIGLPIMTETDLRNFAAYTSFFDATQTVHLGADINLTSPWTPFNLYCQFDGKYNGVTHKITGLNVTASSLAGFIALLDKDASLMNTEFEGTITLSGQGSSSSANLSYAGIVADLSGSIVGVTNRSTISDEESTTCQVWIGGIAGIAHDGANVSKCKNYGNISTKGATVVLSSATVAENTWVGGIVGGIESTGATVDLSENYGSVSCNNVGCQGVGGIVGIAKAGTISQCCNKGVLSSTKANNGNSFIGGVLAFGQNRSSAVLEIKNCVNEAKIINTCTNIQCIAGIVSKLHKYHVGSYKIYRCENKETVEYNTPTSGNQRFAAGIATWVNGTTTVDGNVNRGDILLYTNHVTSTCGGIAALVDRAGETLYNYNFGNVEYAKGTHTADDNDGLGGGIVGAFACREAAYTFTMTGDCALGTITGTGRVGAIYDVVRYDARNFTLTINNPRVGATVKGYIGNKIQTITATDDASAQQIYYSYRRNSSGDNNSYNNPTVSYISAADAEAELAAR